MVFRIQMEQRNDKQKPVMDAILELVDDFIILAGMAYHGKQHRPCWIFEIETDDDTEVNFDPTIKKLKKILGTSAISVRRYPSATQQGKGDNGEGPKPDYTPAEAIRRAVDFVPPEFVAELPVRPLTEWWAAGTEEIENEVSWIEECGVGKVKLRNALLVIADAIEYEQQQENTGDGATK